MARWMRWLAPLFSLSLISLSLLSITLFAVMPSPSPSIALSPQPILRFQSSSSDIATFILSLSNALRLSSLLNYSLMLPTQISIPSISPQTILITDLLNISKFSALLAERYLVKTVLESHLKDHHIRLYHPLLKYNTLNQTLHELEPFLATPNSVLDVGNVFLRMLDTDCGAQKEMAEMLHLLLECFPNEVITLSNALLRRSLPADYHFVHEEGMGEEGATPTTDWESLLSSGIFPTKSLTTAAGARATFIACGSCPQTNHTESFVPLALLVKKLSPSLQQQYTSHASFPHLVSLRIAIGSQQFGGGSLSSFSNLVVSERLYRNSKSHNLCLDLPSPTPFTSQTSHSALGLKSPDVTCSHLQSVESSRHLASLQEIIRHIPQVLDSIGLPSTPFTEMMYILSFEPTKHVLPLVFAYLDIPAGDYDKLFLKIETLATTQPEREVARAGLIRALAAVGISHHSLTPSPPLRILMVIHNSRMQGAPLMAYYVAKMFQEKLGLLVEFFVDEKARGNLEDLLSAQGMKITAGSNFSAINTTEYDLLYLNTIVPWYDQHNISKTEEDLTRLYAEKCVMYVHESIRDEVYKSFPRSPEVMKAAKGLIFVTPRSMSVYHDILLERQALRAAAGQEVHSFVIGNSLSSSVTLTAQLKSERQKYRARLGLSPSDLLFVTSGDIYANRNQHLFVDAANSLLDTTPQDSPATAPKIFFLVIGVVAPYSKYTKSFLMRVRRSRHHKRFLVKKKMPHEESLAYMAAGDVYVSLAWNESFGLALLEAMTMGLPVIVAKLDGVPDVIYAEALDVNLKSVKSVTKAMATMLSPATRLAHSSLSQARSLYFQQQFFFLRHVNTLTRVLRKEGR
jgi:glycosyltransferase involved in cell wall biosynthesis